MPQPLMDPRHAATFQTYRLNVLYQDLPELSPNHMGSAANAISTNIADLVSEQRLTREEDRTRRAQETNKTPKDFYGPGLTRLMRFAQVGTESALQQIHTDIAKSTKQLRRKTLQAALDVSVADLGYDQDFPVSAALAKKVFDLEYYSSLEDNFSVGVNIFCLGQLEPENIEAQRRFIAQSDMLNRNDASASLSDMATILDPTGDVCIPKSLAQLKYNVQKYHALMLTLFGSIHPLVTRQ